MIIAGIQKTSLIDYPKKICTILFTRGCNFFCGFCHNPELVDPKCYQKRIPQYKIFNMLQRRKKIINAVVITGGEPTIHQDLPQFIQKIKKLGYLVKLDTNGSNPKMLQKLINQKLINYVAMDIKNSPRRYRKAAGKKINIKKIKLSVEIIKNSGVKYEFRTTVVPSLHDKQSIKDIGLWLSGARKFILQRFRAGKHLDPNFSKIKPFSSLELKEFKNILVKYIHRVQIR